MRVHGLRDGLTLCGGACANTQDDRGNCGGCGVACGEGTSCVRGRCAATPWLQTYGGEGEDAVLALARDGAGNLYAGGSFSSSITLGANQYTGARGWVARLSPAGTVLWSMLAGRAVRGLAVDGSNQVYAVGTFTGTSSVGTRTLSSAGATDWFAASWSSEGAVRWAVRHGGGADEFAARVAVDTTGRVWVAGFFGSTASFDGRSLTSRGLNDLFVARLGAVDGAPGDIVQVGSGASDMLGGLVADPNDGVALSLSFNGALFAGASMVATGTYDGAVVRFNNDLTARWTTVFGAASNLTVSDLAGDAAGDLYASGDYAVGPVQVGSGSFGSGNFNGFVASLNAAGAYRWGSRPLTAPTPGRRPSTRSRSRPTAPSTRSAGSARQTSPSGP